MKRWRDEVGFLTFAPSCLICQHSYKDMGGNLRCYQLKKIEFINEGGWCKLFTAFPTYEEEQAQKKREEGHPRLIAD